jgi:hypothetical protein
MSARTLHVLAAAFAVYMLARHLPGARALVRREPGAAPMGIVSVVNVLLAVAILAYAVKGLVGGLISP